MKHPISSPPSEDGRRTGWPSRALALGAALALVGCAGLVVGAAAPGPGAPGQQVAQASAGNIGTAVFLGVLQGLTEFLPVSSSGHLLVAQWLLGVDPDLFGLSFDAAIHLGTFVAVLLYFWRDILELAFAWLGSLIGGRRFSEQPVRLAWSICFATIPAVVAGVLFEREIETIVRSPYVVAGMLAGFGALMWIADRTGSGKLDLRDVGLGMAIAVGIAQALALVPGVSRSGVTITAGLFAGLQREAATRFAFLLSAPITFGAGAKQLYDIARGRGGDEGFTLALIGLLTSAIVGYLVIWFLIRWVATRRLDVFVYYRFALATLIVVLGALGIAHV